jgi:hypothetical protein
VSFATDQRIVFDDEHRKRDQYVRAAANHRLDSFHWARVRHDDRGHDKVAEDCLDRALERDERVVCPNKAHDAVPEKDEERSIPAKNICPLHSPVKQDKRGKDDQSQVHHLVEAVPILVRVDGLARPFSYEPLIGRSRTQN